MGVGKTTIGRILASTLKRSFYDTDRVVEERTGADIPWIFDVEGEVGFRKREQAVCEELSSRASLVLATGGGVVVNDVNRDVLSADSFVVYLSASVDQLHNRTRYGTNRPLLNTDNPKKVIENILERRRPLYEDMADIIIDTERCNPRQVVDAIIKEFSKVL